MPVLRKVLLDSFKLENNFINAFLPVFKENYLIESYSPLSEGV